MSPRDSESAALDGQAPAKEGIGRYLMWQRELRGIGLQQIAEQTRISVGNLKALEDDDEARLPSRVFLLGYIRAYARAIGLNPDEAVLRFEEQTQKIQAMPGAARSRAGRGWLLRAGLIAGSAALLALILLLLAQR